MKLNRIPFVLTLASLTALGLGASGCSNGQSPTEPAFDESSLSSASAAVSTGKRHGADDAAGDDRGGRRRGGRGGDDANDDNGGRRGGRQQPRAGVEFEGAVASVSGGGLVLANGTTVIVNGQTQISARGDLRSLAQISAALDAGQDPRVEGRGTRNASGAIVAQTLKAEID
ncbi:MAG: hypothetical protein ACJ75H_05010 [Thermoanaerobaculia bacterium]